MDIAFVAPVLEGLVLRCTRLQPRTEDSEIKLTRVRLWGGKGCEGERKPMNERM